MRRSLTNTVLGHLLLAWIGCGAADSEELAKPRIQSLWVRSDIQSHFATTLVTSKILNPNPEPTEVEFVVILPNPAFINNFTMLIHEDIIVGEVVAKDEAAQIYDAAKTRGESAGLLSQSPRDSNKFSITVNIAASDKIEFNLTYQEVLQRVHGVYKHVLNLSPGQLVDDMFIDVFIAESREITSLLVPKIEENLGEKTNVELLKLTSDPNILIEKESLNQGVAKAHVSHVISKEDQLRFSENGLNSQLVVLYDVERNSSLEEIAVIDGYFVQFFAPSDLPIAPKHVLFTLDDSGSMEGEKIVQLKSAMRLILSELNEGDYFDLLRFDDKASKWKDASVLVSDENIRQATEFTENLVADGGTDIAVSLAMSIDHLQGSVEAPGISKMIIFLTDGIADFSLENVTSQIHKDTDIAIHTIAFGDDAEVYKLTALAMQHKGISKKIYIGSDTTLQLTGFYEEIASPLLLDVAIKYVNGTIDPTSLVRNKEGTYYDGSEMIVVGKLSDSLSFQNFPIMPVIIKGTVTARGRDGKMTFDVSKNVTCTEYCYSYSIEQNATEAKFKCPASCIPEIAPSPPLSNPHSVGGYIERMWAYLTIKGLLDKAKFIATKDDEREKMRANALELSLKYNFVTELTSLVVWLVGTIPANGSNLADKNSKNIKLSNSFGPTSARSISDKSSVGLDGSVNFPISTFDGKTGDDKLKNLPQTTRASGDLSKTSRSGEFRTTPSINISDAIETTPNKLENDTFDGNRTEHTTISGIASNEIIDQQNISNLSNSTWISLEINLDSSRSTNVQDYLQRELNPANVIFKTSQVRKFNVSSAFFTTRAHSRRQCANICFGHTLCHSAVYRPFWEGYECVLSKKAALDCSVVIEDIVLYSDDVILLCFTY